MLKRKRGLITIAGAVLVLSGFLQVTDAPLISQALAKPAKASAAQVRKGKVLFAENCEGCHQEGGGGQPGVAPSITNKELLSIASDKFLTETIRDGREGTPMIAFGEMMKKGDIAAIVGYLRTFSTLPDQSDAINSDRVAKGDAQRGRSLFAQMCAGCHGNRGEGYEVEGSGTAIGGKGFLSKVSDGFIRYIIKNGRSGTAMRGFAGPEGLANLNDQQIDDIITYLRVLQ